MSAARIAAPIWAPIDAADGPHDGVHAGGDAGLGGPDGVDDQLGHGGEGEADPDADRG